MPTETPPPPPPELGTVLAAVDAFLAVQQERAAAYQVFNEGFKRYLDDLKEDPYRALMGAATQEFAKLSGRAVAAETALRGPLGRPDAADIVRTVQENERAKLHVTIALQAVRGAVAEQRFSWQAEEGGGAVVGCEHACAGACGHAAPEEPTEADINGATKESYQQLEACVGAINEAIAEMQELRAELAEGG